LLDTREKFICDLGRPIGLNKMGIATTQVKVILTKTLDSVRTVFPA